MKFILAGIAAGVLLAAPALAQDTTATFIDTSGEESGTATLTATTKGVLIEIEVGGLPSDQWVAFHVHETGNCNHETDHESAGDHFNPSTVEHGYLTETGPHAGDMPNQYVPADGVLRAQVLNPFVMLDDGEASIVGRALMIHAGADDYSTQPSGDAGDRLACAVVE
ncbi:superoxide dismutase family protein [Pelagibacterium luteolum]|uniref:Superoxide dismutase [Cu-Zn] n=1 Tax=Pelagibacterium luteolum TaxID=440168 RepID=A0A1G8AHC0_9HYPH|nr:superoxide dismutase family protein [Pelagibacterium luteolum]SDH20374.1 superoxide dismutase, Cu-Zn family [Pelagibacterium luteolum]